MHENFMTPQQISPACIWIR